MSGPACHNKELLVLWLCLSHSPSLCRTAFRECCPALVVLRGLEGGGLVFSLYLSRAGSKSDNLGAGLGEGSNNQVRKLSWGSETVQPPGSQRNVVLGTQLSSSPKGFQFGNFFLLQNVLYIKLHCVNVFLCMHQVLNSIVCNIYMLHISHVRVLRHVNMNTQSPPANLRAGILP